MLVRKKNMSYLKGFRKEDNGMYCIMPKQFAKPVFVNEVTYQIWLLCDEEDNLDAITNRVVDMYENAEWERVYKDVKRILCFFFNIGVLDIYYEEGDKQMNSNGTLSVLEDDAYIKGSQFICDAYDQMIKKEDGERIIILQDINQFKMAYTAMGIRTRQLHSNEVFFYMNDGQEKALLSVNVLSCNIKTIYIKVFIADNMELGEKLLKAVINNFTGYNVTTVKIEMYSSDEKDVNVQFLINNGFTLEAKLYGESVLREYKYIYSKSI